MINERFALPQAAARIKPLDRALLATERRIFSTISWEWPELDGVAPPRCSSRSQTIAECWATE